MQVESKVDFSMSSFCMDSCKDYFKCVNMFRLRFADWHDTFTAWGDEFADVCADWHNMFAAWGDTFTDRHNLFADWDDMTVYFLQIGKTRLQIGATCQIGPTRP